MLDPDRFIESKRYELSETTLVRYRSDLKILVALATVEAQDSIFAFTPDLVKVYFARLSIGGRGAMRRMVFVQ